MTADLDLADERLRSLWPDLRFAYCADHPGHDVLLTCTYRNPEAQRALYAKGRTAPGRIVTNCDGLQMMSKHNHTPARALDFCILIHGKVSWDSAEYVPVGLLAQDRGFVWGGAWPHFPDYPHIEITEAA